MADTERSLKPQYVDFGKTWGSIRDTINKVIKMDPVSRSEWNDRFHDVYKLCVAQPESLCDRTYDETKKLLDSHIQSLYQEVSQNTSTDLINAYYKKWLVYRQGIQYLGMLYFYLNAQYIRKFRYSPAEIEFNCINPSEQLMEISELGTFLWKEKMIIPLKEELISLLLTAINEDRCGKPQNKNVLETVIGSFIFVENNRTSVKNKLYAEIFEKPFLKATREYYSGQAKILLDQNDCSTYMEKVLALMEIESDRLKDLIPESSHRKLIKEFESCMVGEHMDFLQIECRSMVENEKRRDLHNMYRLMMPIDSGLKALVGQVEAHIKQKGLQTIRCLNPKEENYVRSFVENMLKVYDHYLHLIEDVFESHKDFVTALDMACTEVINHREDNRAPCRSPEILSRYFDNLLKKSSRMSCETEIEEKLSSAIQIFKYINDKDVFQKFYAKMLAKRLIYAQYMSLDMEEMMINKLKQACGYEFTSKLHRMFTDIKICDDLNLQFTGKLNRNKIKLPIAFSIYVLQACAWPMSQNSTSTFTIPHLMERSVTEFEKFYADKFNGRKLTWLHHMSNGEVKFLFTKKVYTVVMSTYHIAIIILFENNDELTYEEIQQNTNLNDDNLQRYLQSFVQAKILLLADSSGSPLTDNNNNNNNGESSEVPDSIAGSSKEEPKSTPGTPPGTTVAYTGETKFRLNLQFNTKRIKFKLIVAQQKESPLINQKEAYQTHATVEEDRKFFLQAAIVRIMKARKTMIHNSLLEEVINQSKNRFLPSVANIKKAIESLIEKQYIERVNNSCEEYRYVA